MSIKKLIWSMLGAASALVLATCAPVDRLPRDGGGPEQPPDTNVEVIPLAPTPVSTADGPRARIEAAIDNVRQRDLPTTTGFWTVFHGILGLGPGLMLRVPDTNDRINAQEHIRMGGEMRGLRFLQTRWGLDVQLGPTGVGQGHQDQFVAEMGQWGMPPDRPFIVNGKEYTFMDFVRHSQMFARTSSNQELSWAIIVVGQYVGLDAAWTNGFGEPLRLEDMLRYELDASVEQAACGGTHRLFGLTWVYHLHLIQGGKTEGVWKDIADKIAKYRDLARKNRNEDGTLSTDFFRGPGKAADANLRINTTGHTLEWLALALTDEEIREPWVQETADALARVILDQSGQPIEGGSLYHAVHGLIMYYARVYGRDPNFVPAELMLPLPPPQQPVKTS